MGHNQVITEEELRTLLAEGDGSAFLAFYRQYNRSVKAFISKYVHSPELVEDLVQEVFIKIWENRSQLSAVQSLKGYLFITARNHTLNSFRKAFRSETVTGELVRAFTQQRNVTEESILDKEYLTFMQRTLDSMPQRSRDIFTLCRQQGKSYEEVAKAMGISKNAVKNHMVFSMRVLRTSAEKELGISLSVLLALLYR